MGAFKFAGIVSLVQVSFLLTTSYFVLFVNRKTEAKSLKIFGYVVAAFLCLAAVIVSVSGIDATVRGGRDRMMMHDMMRSQMQQPMQQPTMRR